MRISDWSSDVCSSGSSGDKARFRLVPRLRWAGKSRCRGLRRIGPPCCAAQSYGRCCTELQDDYPPPHPFALSLSKGRSFCIVRSEEHTSELQSLMRISYAVFCLKKKKRQHTIRHPSSITSALQ